jgi:hypothetical protein
VVAAECAPDVVDVASVVGRLVVGVLAVVVLGAPVLADDGVDSGAVAAVVGSAVAGAAVGLESVELVVALPVAEVELAVVAEEEWTELSAPPAPCTMPERGSAVEVDPVFVDLDGVLDDSVEVPAGLDVDVVVAAEVAGGVDSAATLLGAEPEAEPAFDEASAEEPELPVSASATPGMANAVPTPRKTASAPTRPMIFA